MEKEELLEGVKSLAAASDISKEEILAAYDEGVREKQDTTLTRRLSIPEILYFLGGAIVFIGISILVGQNWETLSDFTKILVTLGSGIAAYLVGAIFSRDKNLGTVGQAFFLISALLLPLGLTVVFHGAGYDTLTSSIQSIIAAILLVVFLVSYLTFRRQIFTIFSIVYGTWFFLSVTNWIAGDQPTFDALRFMLYRILVVGLSYMLLGYYFVKRNLPSMAGWLYAFGSAGFLGAALGLGGWEPEQNLFWELLFPGLAFGMIFLSIHIKAQSALVFGSLFLMAYLLKVTAEYFTDSFGWPLALVVAGFALIAIGYMTFYLNKRYVSTPAKS